MTGSSRIRILLPCAVLIALQWIVFWPALDNKFLLYDDDTYVSGNPTVQSLSAPSFLKMFSQPYFHSYTPLTLLSHAVDYSLWKTNPRGHHLTSVVLHCANSVMMFFMCLLLFRVTGIGESKPSGGSLLTASSVSELAGAFISATLFSIHPLRVESVAWISDRKDLLLGLFSLSSVIAYMMYVTMRSSPQKTRWYLLSFACFLLALLSKSTAVVLPVVLLFLDALLPQKNNWRALIKEKLPFILLAMTFGVVPAIAAKGGTASDVVFRLSGLQRVLLPLYTLIFYPAKILWPNDLTPIYDSPGFWWMVAGVVASTAVTVAVVAQARRGNKHWLVAWLCYVVCIVPTITGLSGGIQPWADRYSYVSTISLFALTGGGLRTILARPNRTVLQIRTLIITGILVAVVCTWCFLSREQMGIWRDSETLFRYAVEKAPASPMAHGNLGQALLENNDLEGAIVSIRKAIALEPRYPGALYNAGIAFERKQNPDSAAVYYGQAIAVDTTYVNAYVNLANLFVNLNRPDEAIPLYERAAALAPSDADVYYNLGNALYLKGDRRRALESYRTAVRISPGYASAYHNMGIILLNLGDADAALVNFQRAARLGSSDAQRLLSSKGYSW